MAETVKMQIVGIELDYDLNKIRARSEVSRAIAKKHSLEDGKAILFSNKRYNRVRVLWLRKETLFVIVPEIDPGNDSKVYHNIIEALKDLVSKGNKEACDVVEALRALAYNRVYGG